MGCSAGKPEPPHARALSHNVGRPGSPQPQGARGKSTSFACFLSHFKTEAATEARWLQRELEEAINEKVFLDSDDLTNLASLCDHVRASRCVLMLQTKSVLTRLWCIVELVTAIDAGVPIVGVSIISGTAPYDFEVASNFMTYLDTYLDAETQAQLSALGVDVVAAAFKLANTLPKIISVPLNMSESRTVLSARVTDIVSAMGNTVVPVLPTDRDAWLATRGTAPALPRHGPPGASANASLAPLPPEVPTLPASTVTRPELIAALKKRVINPQAAAGAEEPAAGKPPDDTTKSVTTVTAPPKKQQGSRGIGDFFGLSGNTTAAAGMGGVGKTMMAAALAHDGEVRSAFGKICWVSVGQEPDTTALQNTLHVQLTKRSLPDAAKADARVALEELKDAANDMSVLLVLDDVWVASQATPLNFVNGSASRSAVVVTTRIRSLLDGAAEVSCGTLSAEASLELLLRAGGCEHLLSEPPPAALEAIELCGRLPLALGIAGGIIEGLGTTWQAELCQLLKDEFEEASVEERVVTASLRAVPEAKREGVEALFTLFAIFAEDSIVPDTAIDVLAPLIPNQAAKKKMEVRRWLQQLLKANILRGSIESGVSVHDLVRDCMIRRAEAVREGGLRATQREAVPLLLDALDAGGPAASYVSANLHWHVRQAQQTNIAIDTDTVLMSVLTHESGDVRKQGAIGVGIDKLRAAAKACDKSGDHLEAAQLMWAASAVRGQVAGAELQLACASIKRLEAAGRGSSASRALESRVLQGLFLATLGGFAFGSDEHNELLERMEELARRPSVQGATNANKEAFDAEYGLVMTALFAAWALESMTGYSGPVTRDTVVKAHMHLGESAAHCLQAEAVAPDEASVQMVRSMHTFATVYHCRPHALPEFTPTTAFGEGGERLRQTIER